MNSESTQGASAAMQCGVLKLFEDRMSTIPEVLLLTQCRVRFYHAQACFDLVGASHESESAYTKSVQEPRVFQRPPAALRPGTAAQLPASVHIGALIQSGQSAVVRVKLLRSDSRNMDSSASSLGLKRLQVKPESLEPHPQLTNNSACCHNS